MFWSQQNVNVCKFKNILRVSAIFEYFLSPTKSTSMFLDLGLERENSRPLLSKVEHKLLMKKRALVLRSSACVYINPGSNKLHKTKRKNAPSSKNVEFWQLYFFNYELITRAGNRLVTGDHAHP